MESKNITYSSRVNGIFPHGCTIAVQCRYRFASCTGNLSITLNNEQLDKAILVTNSSNCTIEVNITNLTAMDFHQKTITCKIDNVSKRSRTLEVGCECVCCFYYCFTIQIESLSMGFILVMWQMF